MDSLFALAGIIGLMLLGIGYKDAFLSNVKESKPKSAKKQNDSPNDTLKNFNALCKEINGIEKVSDIEYKFYFGSSKKYMRFYLADYFLIIELCGMNKFHHSICEELIKHYYEKYIPMKELIRIFYSAKITIKELS